MWSRPCTKNQHVANTDEDVHAFELERIGYQFDQSVQQIVQIQHRNDSLADLYQSFKSLGECVLDIISLGLLNRQGD